MINCDGDYKVVSIDPRYFTKFYTILWTWDLGHPDVCDMLFVIVVATNKWLAPA